LVLFWLKKKNIAKQFLASYMILLCGTGHKKNCNKYVSILHVYMHSNFGEVTGESIKIC